MFHAAASQQSPEAESVFVLDSDWRCQFVAGLDDPPGRGTFRGHARGSTFWDVFGGLSGSELEADLRALVRGHRLGPFRSSAQGFRYLLEGASLRRGGVFFHARVLGRDGGVDAAIGMPTILVAAQAGVQPVLLRALGSSCRLMPVSTFEGAVHLLETDPAVALAVCGVHFDDSRMFDLLSYVAGSFPDLSFLACRVLDSPLPRGSRSAVELAAQTLHARWLDLRKVSDDLGPRGAELVLRVEALACLRRSRR